MILLWPCNFAPVGWAFCNGALLPISQNQALFSLIGTFYGGDGRTTFALPDFRGRVPVGAGSAPIGTYTLGEVGGVANTTLTINQMPMHSHTVTISASNQNGTVSAPAAGTNTLGAIYDVSNANPISGYNNMAPNTPLNTAGTTSVAGGSQPFSVMQPFLSVNYIIALQGIFPSRS